MPPRNFTVSHGIGRMKVLRQLLFAVLGSFLGLNSTGAVELKFVAEPFPPFVFEVAGTQAATGPLVEVTMAVCERIKAHCSVDIYPWRRALEMAEHGLVDGMFPLVPTQEREKLFHLSAAVVTSAASFFVQESSAFKYTQPSDLDRYSIGVYGPSANSMLVGETLKSGSTGRMEIELNNITVLRKLSVGRYGDTNRGVAVVNKHVGQYLIKSEKITGIQYGGDLKKVSFSIAFPRKKVTDGQFQEFNTALKSMTREGKLRAILEKYEIR